jgi:hypothetical protein
MFMQFFHMEITTVKNEVVKFNYDGHISAGKIWSEVSDAAQFPQAKAIRFYVRTVETDGRGDIISETFVTFFEWTKPSCVKTPETAEDD